VADTTTCFWCHTLIHVRHALVCPSCAATILQRAASEIVLRFAQTPNCNSSELDPAEVEGEERANP